ncbi:MAG: hypothetical protein JWO44_1580 [Bacteroidetes bacterium]|nr:hypothetical protein [Bacteroidota bacterium]
MSFLRLKKPLLLVCFFGLLLSLSVSSQNPGDYQTIGSGNWNNPAIWQKCVTALTWAGATNTFPPVAGATGVITINNTHTITINLAVANGASIVVANGGTLQTAAAITLTNNASGIITVNGTLINSATLATGVIINNGAINNNLTFTNNGTVTNNLTLNNATGATITQNGTAFTNNAAGTVMNFGTLTIPVTKTFTNNGTISNSGTINSGGALGTLTFANGSFYRHNFSSLAAPAGTIPTATWSVGSTCEIQACGNSGSGPAGLTQVFKNFTWNNTTQPVDVNLAGTLQTINTAFTMSSTNNFNLILRTTAAGANTSVGNFIFNNGKLIIDNILLGAIVNPALTVGGSFTMAGGTLTISNASGTGGNNGNGQFTVSGTSTISGGSVNLSTSTWVGAGGNGTFNAAGLITLNGGTINLASNVATATSGCGGTLNANGGILISGGNLELTSSAATTGGGNGILNVGGAFTHTGGTVSKTGANTGTVNISGSVAQTIESIGFTSGHVIAFNLIQTGASGTCSIAATKTFVLNPGTTFMVNDNTFTGAELSVDGTFTANTNAWNCVTPAIANFNNGAQFINNVNTAIAANSDITSLNFLGTSIFVANANGGEVATATWAATSTVQVNGITTATTLGNGGQSFGQIYWDCAGQTVSTDFGTTGFDVQGLYTVNNTGTGTLRFPDLDFTLGGSPNSLTVQNAAKLQLSNAVNLYATGTRTITAMGNVSVLNTAFLTTGPPNTGAGSYSPDQSKDLILLLKGNFTYSSTTAPVTFDHRSFAAFGDESYHLILNFGGAAQAISFTPFAGNLVTITGDGAANSGTDDEFQANNLYSLIVASTSTLSPSTILKGKYFQVDAGGTLILSSNLTHYSLLTASGATDNPATVINGTSTAVFGTIDFGTTTLTDVTGTGTFTLNNFAKLKTKNTLGITSSGLNGSVQVTGARTFSNSGYYLYNNTAAAQVTGNGLPTNITNTLEIQTVGPGAGGVTLSQATSVTTAAGKLTLTSGRLITATATLITIGAGAAVSPIGGAATKYVDGPIKKLGNTAFIFPTGDFQAPTSKWARIEITAPAAVSDGYTAEYNYVNPHTPVGAIYGTGITDVSYREYWTLTRTAGTATPTVTLYWENGVSTAAGGSGIFSTASADLHIGEWYNNAGNKWNDHGTGTVTGSTSIGTINTSITPVFVTGTAMPFTFVGPTIVNPLPIELLSFTGVAGTDGNLLSWSTATETNNDYFELERGSDASTFVSIGTIDGHGNSSSVLNYDFPDHHPMPGINYYRLKQVDFNGDYTYSNAIAIDTEEDSFVLAYPNPSSSQQVSVGVSENISEISIYNMMGEVVYHSGLVSGKTFSVDVLAKGVYVIKAISSDNKLITSKFTRE